MSLQIKLFDRYIFFEILSRSYSTLLIMLACMCGSISVLAMIRRIVQFGMPTDSSACIVALSLPENIIYCLPASVLIATLITFQRLSKDSEVTAMLTSGISFYRLMVAPLLVGLLAIPISFVILHYAMPVAWRSVKTIFYVGMKKSASPFSHNAKNAIVLEQAGGGQKIVLVRDVVNNTAKNVVILNASPNHKVIEVTTALTGNWARGDCILQNGAQYQLSDTCRQSKFEKLVMPWDHKVVDGLECLKDTKLPEEMNTPELQNFIASAGKIKLPTEVLINFHRRWSRPFACFLIVFAAGHFGLLRRRAHYWIGFVCGAIVLTIYYAIQGTTQGLAENGRIAPMLAAWLPNIVIGLFGLIILPIRAKSF